ncbi:alpha/beta fold hydrolase [Pseudonocardia sp.]|jgi:2-hydroxy-6-oxonona-2,4-dienedioate hydrolase|uniref:alpha/beta fold hydrolase n=1 Tax=Pseudonocardia sp. TaxID=60912 RepID=UPI00262F556E|nr:alpha/beta fold hydrolase [Pseudonocardia sp.]MCW2721545.1 alpha/beta hydrolase fold protein [Pseudonocardia sp.]MDT7617333.1 2-hydroxy-6-oxonona-2,4-dienedioate hydrolase [Pseudonocardiales bacterium]
MSRPSIWSALAGLEFTVRYVQVGEWRTRVLETGTGEPLVLMHGTGGHIEAYSHNLVPLSQHFRVIAYEYPGHGWTTHTTRDLELPDYVAHLDGLLDALDVERAHLSGESLGGWLALKYAAAHPERVGRVLLNTPGGTMATPEVMERIRSLSQAAADDPSHERIKARLEWLMADPSSVTEELVDIRRTIYARPGFADSMRHLLCLQDPEIRARNLVTDAELAAVVGPAMVVWTSDDPSGPAAAGMAMADKMPDARFEVIKDAGHWPQWEQHEVFNALAIDFLTGKRD